jgi:hypothetical protein
LFQKRKTNDYNKFVEENCGPGDTEIVVALVGVVHHPLHGGVVVLHLPSPLGSCSGGAAQDKPDAAPLAALPVVRRASKGGHGWPGALGADAAGREDARDEETRGVRHSRAVIAGSCDVWSEAAKQGGR